MRDISRFRTHAEILKHSHPELVVQLVHEPRDNPVEIVGHAEDLAMKWNGKHLHGLRSASAEAARLLEKIRIESGFAYLVFGVGLGHLARAVRDLLPPRAAMILFEPDIRILRESLGCVDFRPLLFDDRMRWVSGKDWREHLRIVLRHCEESGLRTSTAILSLPAYRTYFGGMLSEVRSILAQFLNEREIDTETRKRLWSLWNHNLSENLPGMLSSAPLRIFTSTFQKIPAVLVGAGPGLDRQYADLIRLRENALIIAADTALSPLLSAGCVPDIVLAMDAQEENERDFYNLPPHAATLLFDAFCYPAIPKLYPPEFRIASQTGHVLSDISEPAVVKNGLLPLLDHILDFEFGFLQNGGSVITAGFDLARLAGCSAVGLVGADMSYPGFQTHSKGTQRSLARLSAQSRFITPEMHFFADLSEKSQLLIPNSAGGKVWCDRVMLMYKHWMEDAAVKTGLPCFYLGDIPGVFFKGYAQSTPGEFAARFGAARAEINARLARCRAAPRFGSKVDEIQNRLTKVRRDLAALDTDPSAETVGPFDLDCFVSMASFEVAERLRLVLASEPETEHKTRRQQAARTCRPWVTPFLDRLESALSSTARIGGTATRR